MRVALLLAVGVMAVGACQPSDRRPGLWLDGEPRPVPPDWSFTNAHREVALEVRAPYFLPHSVTVFCASDGSALYIGARDPASKNWPDWVDANPEVVLKVAGDLYALRAEPIDDPDGVALVRAAYATKYGGAGEAVDPVPIRYWRLVAR